MASLRSACDPKRTWRRVVRGLTQRQTSSRLARERVCSLEQLEENSNHRYKQEQENGLQDSHHPRFVVVHSICHRSPHFGSPYLCGLVSSLRTTGRPPPWRGRPSSLRLTARDGSLRVPASAGTRPPRTTCRVRHHPRRRCLKSAPRHALLRPLLTHCGQRSPDEAPPPSGNACEGLGCFLSWPPVECP